MSDNSIDRRTLVISGASALALLGISRQSTLAAVAVQSADGIAGGGSMQAGGGPAEFSVFAARFSSGENEKPRLAGALSYLDVVGKTSIESTSITACGPVEGSESTTRQLSGIATMNGSGAHPFNAVLTDGGPIGSGADMFELAVGPDGATDVSDAIYEVQSVVQAGNLQLIVLTFDETSGATPTAAG